MGKLTNQTLFKELSVPNGDEEAARLEAGPMGMAIQKLQKTGLFSQETLQAAQQILSMDDSQFTKVFPEAGQGGPPVAE
jgi:hypothetical protein